jgi:transglutaminase-like putative cysteine protease
MTFSFFNLLAQPQPKELEDVTLEMLREQRSSLDSTAAAEVLYEKGKVTFSVIDGFKYEYDVVRRIKIYTQDGYDEANVQIPYFVGELNSDRESVSKIDGYVYYEKDGEVEREKIRNRDVFDLDLSENWEAKKFTIPRIQDGVIIEYSYTIDSPHIHNLPKWVFQDHIPTRYSEYTTRIPNEYIAYNIRTQGYRAFESSRNMVEGNLFVGTGTMRTSVEETISIALDVPKIEEEPYINNINNYLPTISYELSSFRTDEYGTQKSVARSWDDVVKTLAESDSYEKELARTKYFEDDLNRIVNDLKLPQDKMNAIFEFLKQRMTWNEEERKYTSDKLHRVYDEGLGNSADINLMLTAMLRMAGLDANPIISSTVSKGIPLFPTLSGFNYVFTHVDINGQEFLLDATEGFSSPNVLPNRVLNWNGTVIKKDGFKTIGLIPSLHSSKKYQIQAQLNDQGEISGKCRIISQDQFALKTRKSIFKKSPEELKLRYEKNFKAAAISDISSLNLQDQNKPLVENFSFTGKEKFVEEIGNKLYLSPMLFLKMEENPFKKETRIFPVDFTHPRILEYFIVIKIPSEYKIDYIPNQEILKLGNDVSKLTYLVNGNKNIISVNVKHEINTSIFLPQDYKNLREFYISLMNKENEKIVLVKS